MKTDREESLTGDLTGINSRKAFDQYLQSLVSYITKSNEHFSILRTTANSAHCRFSENYYEEYRMYSAGI